MTAMQIFVYLLAMWLAESARVKQHLSPLGKDLALAQAKIAKVEEQLEHDVAEIVASHEVEKTPEMGHVKAALELGKKPKGSNSIKGSMSVTLDPSAPKPEPVDGQVPMAGEIVFKADTEAQAKKLVENIEKMVEKFLAEDMQEMKEQLPTIEVDGSSIKVKGEHSMPYDESQYDSLKKGMETTHGFELSHDLYLDLDMWVKSPSMRYMDVFFGMKFGGSVSLSKKILEYALGGFEEIIADKNTTEKLKGALGDNYEDVVQKLKGALKGEDVTIGVPGFQKIKDEVENITENDINYGTFEDFKKTFEVDKDKLKNVTGNEYAVAALNFVQQAAAANLRFSSMSISAFSGAMKVSWTLEGFRFLNTMALVAENSGADEIVYGSTKPEEYDIPGVESEEEIKEMASLGKDESGALFMTCHSVVIATAVALIGWAM